MSITIVFTFFLLQVCTSEVYVGEFAKVCSRIYFEQYETNPQMPLQLIDNNVFVKTKIIRDNFPVYKAERRPLYFLYISKIKKFVFASQPDGYGLYKGLFLNGNQKIIKSRKWLESSDKSTLPFGNSIFKTIKNSYSAYFRPVCISQYHVSFCGFNEPIFFTLNYSQGNISWNNPEKDSFEPIRGLYKNSRPVYQHTNFAITGWYLYHTGDFWYIGPDYEKAFGKFRTPNYASRPELVTNWWREYMVKESGESLEFLLAGARMQCRGVRQNASCPHFKPCHNEGMLYFSSQNETVCACPLGWTGTKCSKKVKMCSARFTDDQKFNMEVGTIWTQRCPNENYSSFMCTTTGWQRMDGLTYDCQPPAAEKPTDHISKDNNNQPTAEIFNADEYLGEYRPICRE